MSALYKPLGDDKNVKWVEESAFIQPTNRLRSRFFLISAFLGLSLMNWPGQVFTIEESRITKAIMRNGSIRLIPQKSVPQKAERNQI